MILKDKNTGVVVIARQKKKNVFSPSQVRRAGGINAIVEKFSKLRGKSLPSLGFSDAEWDAMLKNES